MVVDAPADDMEVLKQALECSTNKGRVGTHKQFKNKLDTGMDYFINTDVRPGFKCRRKVFHAWFDDESAKMDHIDCDSSKAEGCNRCSLPQPKVCYDLHQPAFFDRFHRNPIPKFPRPSNRSRVTTYKMGITDLALHTAFKSWREDKTKEVYGEAHLVNIGPSLFMSNNTLTRIVDCTHHFQVQGVKDLNKETRWQGCLEYGQEVVLVVLLVEPPPQTRPPLVSTPLPSRLPDTVATHTTIATPTVPRKNKCRACGVEGHNIRNQVCA
ncbi:hypothetical protein SERLADRAFT_378388 [Serpula lacrymans var. lacrymans S7.9]|uniref:Uncharacterized protein n=1 Tax=Serpula lacrymans var. lacrymans (strain S7.9) TaxID=578457 RepID=F8NHW4_SERL9|nr:uncharacterized protein SERLADRAFT_378388 [Serpula lacrymans var. lacrymans S7.9]EGO29474.1 hypothetical protein SERLADRAFT_378388 [Serpula lacrymans var. lacrymans S7.9]